jgi:hypothetical protein
MFSSVLASNFRTAHQQSSIDKPWDTAQRLLPPQTGQVESAFDKLLIMSGESQAWLAL